MKDWGLEMETRLTAKIDEYKEDFNTKLLDLETQTNASMMKSEEIILGKLKDLQVESNNDIKISFDTKMSAMDNKLDMFMNMIQGISKSTRLDDTNVGVTSPGKCS